MNLGLVAASLRLHLGLARSVKSLEFGSAEAQNTILLVITQPRLLGITEHATGDKVDKLANDDKNKGDGVQEVNGVAKDPDSDNDTPEVGSQQRNVEERRTSHAQHDGDQNVEKVQAQGVTDDPADNLTVPGSVIERLAVENGGLDSVDTHAKQTQERQDVVQVSSRHEPLLKHVGGTVEGGTEKGEQVTLDHVKTATTVGAADVVTANQDAHTTTADQDTNDLEDSVADLEKEEGNDHDTDDSPKVDELGRQNVGVSVGQNSKVVSLNVQERHDEILPAILDSNLPPTTNTIFVEEDWGVDEEHEDVVEDGLEGGNVCARIGKEAGEGVGGRDAQSKNLSKSEDDPKVDGGQVAVPVDRLYLEGVNALADGGILVGGC